MDTNRGVSNEPRSTYDAFRHFCQASFLKGDDVVAPLTAYFDASGSERESTIWTVGGWIGTVDDWIAINEEWRAMLDSAPFRPNIEPQERMFHASDLETCKGIYAGWSEAEKQSFQNQAYGIIEKFPSLTAISSSLIKADWQSLGLELDTVKRQHPNADIHPGNYFVHVVFDVLRNVRKWADAAGHSGPIQYFFERGDIGMGDVMSALEEIEKNPKRKERYRMDGWSFQSKQLLPLQAADIWAYESGKQMLNRIVAGPLRERRYPFNRLWRERYQPYNTFWDREELERRIMKAKKP
jgi:hypothetical protein